MTSSLKTELRFFISLPAIVWQVLFFYAPLLIMLLSSVLTYAPGGAESSLAHFYSLCSWTYMRVILSSFLLSFTTTLLCLIIAFPIAYFIAFHGKRWKNFLLFLLIVPFWTNFLLHIYAWFFVLERGGFLNQLLLFFHVIEEPISFLNSLFSIMVMMVYYFLPFMVLPIYSSLERLDPTLLEVSLDLGASWSQTLVRVLLPLTMPAIQVGVLLVYIPAFGEFVIPELMGGNKYYFVGNVISQMILGESSPPLGSAFTIVCSIALTISVLLIRWGMRQLSNYLLFSHPFRGNHSSGAELENVRSLGVQ